MPSDAPSKTGMTDSGAMLAGVSALVGAAIFALPGEASAVLGSAVWIAFLVAALAFHLDTAAFDPAKCGVHVVQGAGRSWAFAAADAALVRSGQAKFTARSESNGQ